jgi:hypothetical protein
MTKEARNVKMRTGALQTSDHFNPRWSAYLEPEHDMDDVLNPAFWSINAPRIERDAIIEIRTVDQRFFAEVYVMAASKSEVIVKVLRHYDLQGEVAALTKAEMDQYDVVWKGPTAKWCVVRRADKVKLAERLEDKGEAHNWIKRKQAA